MMFLAWIVFPLALALLCGGCGLLCRELFRFAVAGSLIVPIGFAAIVVVAGLTTSNSVTAPITIVLIALLAVAGLALGVYRRAHTELNAWPIAAAVGAFLVFGAPVILSGHPTFTGYLKLDDTSTWLQIVDRVMSHGRSLTGLPASTYALNLKLFIQTMGYPIGSMLPWGVGRGVTGTDAAWVFQPYLAFCGAVLALIIDGLLTPAVPARWLRAVLAFLAAQPALLYGYSQWGGVKEVVAAVLVALLAATVVPVVSREAKPQTFVPLILAGAALAGTMGGGAVVWVGPAYLFVAIVWIWRAVKAKRVQVASLQLAGLTAAAAALMLPAWIELAAFDKFSSGQLFSSHNAVTGETGLVSLYHPLRALQLGGIWPIADFRDIATTGRTAPFLIAVAIGIVALLVALVRRQTRDAVSGVVIYALIGPIGTLAIWLSGAIPWVVGKSMASIAPVLLTAGLLGAGVIYNRFRPAGVILILAIGAGVIWSNALAYGGVLLAPYSRLSELQQVAQHADGKGPTFINQYDVYADRHFLRDADSVEPAEYRSQNLPLINGTLLTQSATADLDSFPQATLAPYRSIVTPRTPLMSRPPSNYHLVWQGRYYQLWQRPVHPTTRIITHVPLGDSTQYPYCGRSESGEGALCSVDPVLIPTCSSLQQLAKQAAGDHAELVAYQRPAPIVARANETQWPGGWDYDPSSVTLTPTKPGNVVAHIRVAVAEPYALWLGGSFARGFQVSVDGRHLGDVSNQIGNIGQYLEIGTVRLTPGVHTVVLRYPPAGDGPGSGAELWTNLTGIALQPATLPKSELLTVAPGQVQTLCGRPLDWVEIVAPAA